MAPVRALGRGRGPRRTKGGRLWGSGGGSPGRGEGRVKRLVGELAVFSPPVASGPRPEGVSSGWRPAGAQAGASWLQ